MSTAESPRHMANTVDELARRFTERAIPREEWTHLAHLAVGTWHVHQYGPAEALVRLREGIRRLNDSHGTVNSPTSGYHETVTRAYVCLLSAFLADCPHDMPLGERVTRVLTGPLGHRNVLFKFYSQERLMSALGRSGWVEPDIAPFPLAAVLEKGEL